MTPRGAIRGAAITLVGQGAKLGIQVAAIAVLSRLLPASDFGNYALIVAVAGVAAVFGDLGLTLAAVQAKTVSTEQMYNLFWINSVVGGIAAGIAAAIAIPLASIYGAPEIVGPMQVLALVFLVNGMSAQYKADLSRKFKFRWLAASEVLGQAVGLVVAVTMATSGTGIWALVAQQVVATLVVLISSVCVAGWLPGRPVRQTDLRSFVSIGSATSATQLVNYVSSNADFVIIGKVWGPTILGVYSRAFQIFALPLQQIAAPLTRVVLPFLSQAPDKDSVLRSLERAQFLMCYGLVIFLGVLAGAADPIVRVVLGPGWEDAPNYLEILALGGVFQVMGYVYYWLFLALGKMSILLWCETAGRIVMVGLMVALVQVGPRWVAVGYSTGLIAIWVITTFFGLRRVLVPKRRLLLSALRPVILGIVLALTCRIVVILNEKLGAGAIVQLTAATLSCALVAFIVLLVPQYKKDSILLRNLGKAMITRA